MARTVASQSENFAYRAFHAPRFEFLLEVLRQRLGGRPARLLDVGLSPLTGLLAERLNTPVDCLGLEPDAALAYGHQYQVDLNGVSATEGRRDLGPYEVIVFAEVIEHLYTAPELVLAYLRTLLTPDGLLLVQTPNASAMRKRLKLLLGHNPFERLRTDPSNPGHFREYTAAELTELLEGAGFAVEHVWLKSYFDARFARHDTGAEPPAMVEGTVKNVLHRLLPGPFREGITVLARSRGPSLPGRSA